LGEDRGEGKIFEYFGSLIVILQPLFSMTLIPTFSQEGEED
jgi:hypothetical protein